MNSDSSDDMRQAQTTLAEEMALRCEQAQATRDLIGARLELIGRRIEALRQELEKRNTGSPQKARP